MSKLLVSACLVLLWNHANSHHLLPTLCDESCGNNANILEVEGVLRSYNSSRLCSRSTISHTQDTLTYEEEYGTFTYKINKDTKCVSKDDETDVQHYITTKCSDVIFEYKCISEIYYLIATEKANADCIKKAIADINERYLHDELIPENAFENC